MNCELAQGHALSAVEELGELPAAERQWLLQELPASVPSEVREEIELLASGAREGQLGDLIAATLVRRRVDWRRVPLAEMKRLVLAATLAARGPAERQAMG